MDFPIEISRPISHYTYLIKEYKIWDEHTEVCLILIYQVESDRYCVFASKRFEDDAEYVVKNCPYILLEDAKMQFEDWDFNEENYEFF